MPKTSESKESLESLIAEIKELISEVKDEQNNISKQFQKHHSVTMRKLEKLKEFNEIADMTNEVFERRICNIEAVLNEVLIQIKK